MATISGVLSEPIRVADLPLPPDVAAEVEAICRSHPKTYTRSQRAAVRDDFILRALYAGHRIIATTGSPGLTIHAIDLETADEVNDVYERLRAQGHRDVCSLYPTSWSDDVAIITGSP
ncbi:MAG TPA: hypothetical protein VKA46_21485 [Gemmataceae bacterium]|nr:hypothetical protein [Gemmataceae bacterium]